LHLAEVDPEVVGGGMTKVQVWTHWCLGQGSL